MKIEKIEKIENREVIPEEIYSTLSPSHLEGNCYYLSDIHSSIKQNLSFEGNKHKLELGSCFDAEHPYPTFEQLCDVGFRSDVALSISEEYRNPYSISPHPYTKRELYRVLYESDDPVKAYNEMMEEKMQKKLEKFDRDSDDFMAKYGKYL